MHPKIHKSWPYCLSSNGHNWLKINFISMKKPHAYATHVYVDAEKLHTL